MAQPIKCIKCFDSIHWDSAVFCRFCRRPSHDKCLNEDKFIQWSDTDEHTCEIFNENGFLEMFFEKSPKESDDSNNVHATQPLLPDHVNEVEKGNNVLTMVDLEGQKDALNIELGMNNKISSNSIVQNEILEMEIQKMENELIQMANINHKTVRDQYPLSLTEQIDEKELFNNLNNIREWYDDTLNDDLSVTVQFPPTLDHPKGLEKKISYDDLLKTISETINEIKNNPLIEEKPNNSENIIKKVLQSYEMTSKLSQKKSIENSQMVKTMPLPKPQRGKKKK